ncbi:hypothetical protein GQ43DRAFT_438955 [Delitschia confertaspora ATCC 74209]|uniref:Translation initiation factor 3 N-terminal domain-containing protein n=1 Tax=Delitschia confertaspora ATCC 74209 TaxID=1513339 RepID=A0A9P4JTY6_9PLEO|nr:hypothetical protein GQ43DRAFT_438955 [Delitschia confertaspora ATCC 74209]
MPPFHLSGTSRALYRVFIAPTLPISSRTLQPSLFIPSSSRFLPQLQHRTKTYKKKDTARHALSDYYVFDAAIDAPVIHFIDETGNRHPFMPKDHALRHLDPKTHHLLQVTPGSRDSFDKPDPSNPPTCRIISKLDLRVRHKKKMDIASKAAKIASGGEKKQLELNWAIGENDLKHRLGKLREMLEGGKKVEVLLAPKRKGRSASSEECEAVLEKIREVVGGCKGSGETKEPEGKLGGLMTLVIQGKRVEKEKKTEE